MSTESKTHNESKAEFNGAGETVDASLRLVKPELDRSHAVVFGVALAAGYFVAKVVAPKLASGLHTAAVEVAEATD